MNKNKQQLEKLKSTSGFISALDQSGGSTPKALGNYGIDKEAYSSDIEMFDLVHEMRTRMITSPVYNAQRILGAILFEDTMDRSIEGKSSANYLWDIKKIIPFLKIDKGLATENNNVQIMKPMPGLDALLQKAVSHNIFGTKMRSFIKDANSAGINAVVHQQFEIAQKIMAHGLVPMIEPEIDIHSPNKAQAEVLLKKEILRKLDELESNQLVMLKLTLPEVDNFYTECIKHPNVVKVVALSGGYSRDKADAKLIKNNGVIASFSRALWEGLNVKQSDEVFNTTLDASIESIFKASST